MILLTSGINANEISKTDYGSECVILLHGIARTSTSMRKLNNYLKNKGYKTVNYDYPSRKKSIINLAETVISLAIKQCRQTKIDKMHFVTHSLGGIVVRQYLQSRSMAEGSRLVMIAPPNKGSEAADYLKDFFLYKWFFGPAGQELGTGEKSVPNKLSPINIEVGVIAGNSSINPLFSNILPGPDDGAVSVEGTKLKEMSDFIVVSSNHTFIMQNERVIRQVVHFLENGKFDYGDNLAVGRKILN